MRDYDPYEANVICDSEREREKRFKNGFNNSNSKWI